MKMGFLLFLIFGKIGLFTLGGGYAMLPLMETELTEKRTWLTKQDFLDITALAQSAPGILAVNMAIFTGYKLAGIWGAVWAALGAVMASFCVILSIAIFFHDFGQNELLNHIFMGIRPAVVALIAVPVWRLAKSAHITLKNAWLPLGCALAVWLGGVSPVYIVLAAGVGGFLWGRLK